MERLNEDNISDYLRPIYTALKGTEELQDLAYTIGMLQNKLHSQAQLIAALTRELKDLKEAHQDEVNNLSDQIYQLKQEAKKKHGGGRKPQYTPSEKQEILDYLDCHSYKATSTYYGVSTSTLQSWLKQK